MLKRILFFSLIGLVPQLHFAQIQHPPGIQWTQVKTPHFKVIAPAEITDKAVETAILMEHVYKPVSSTLLYPKKRLKLLLYSQTVYSNGFVTLAPTFSGFYTTPVHDANRLGGTDWMQQLAVHEYRHYVQFEKLNDHFTQFMKGLFGEGGQGGITMWSTPQWMFEGDAICSETTLSAGGRGRLPAFSMAIRANELEDIRFKYDKAYLGSYKDYVPNHYYLGYTLCSGIKANYGLASWDKIMTRSSRFSFWPYSFTRSIKKITGNKFKHIYSGVLNEYDSIWTAKYKEQVITEYNTEILPKKVYTNYTYPFRAYNGDIICLKQGMADTPQLCFLKDGEETVISQVSPVDRIHSNGKQVVWSVVTPDIRWGERNFADVVMLDLQSNTKRKITHRQKYFAPAISPDGTQIIAVEYTEKMECNLVVLDVSTGDVISSYRAPDNSFIRMPSWSGNSKQVVFTESKGQGIALSVLNTDDGSFERILSFSDEVISSPVFYNDYILYNSAFMGVDAIYAVHKSTSEQHLVSAGKYGVYNVTVSGNELVFQNYTTKGHSIATAPVNREYWQPKTKVVNVFDRYYDKLLEQERYGNIFEDTIADKSETYKTGKYRPLLKAINIHSWAPSIVPNGVGYEVYSNDILNTTYMQAGFNYFPLDNAYREFINLNFSKYYPVISVHASHGLNYRSDVYSDHKEQLVRHTEKVLGVGAMVPLNLSGETYNSRLNLSLGYNYVQQKFDSLPNSTNGILDFTALKVGYKYSYQVQGSVRDLYPRYGVQLRSAAWFGPSAKNFVATEGILFLPGLAKHHTFGIKGGYQYTTPYFNRGIYNMPDEIEFTRGYGKVEADEKLDGTLTYTLPLLYPDFRIGPVIYLKRIHTSLFVDYGLGITSSSWQYYNSLGFDLNFEVNLFRFIGSLEMGFRYSYLPRENTMALEFLMFRTIIN